MPNVTTKSGDRYVDPGGDPAVGHATHAGVARTIAVTDASRTSNVVTATVAAPHDLNVGQPITVDLADATYDGSFTVSNTTLTTVSWAQTAANDASSGAGTITIPHTSGGFAEAGGRGASTQYQGWRQRLIDVGAAV